MLISVVIIFHNQLHYVRRALRSVICQTYPNLDIVVVDDGSEESIEAEVQRVDDARIRFFRKKNGGAASARNKGIREAKGEYIAFLDGDDVYLPGKIEALVCLLKGMGCPQCVATTGAYVVNKQGRFTGRIKARSYAVGELIDSSLVRPSCALYHKEIFTALGGFPEHMKSNEDGALNTVIAQHYPIVAIPEALVLYQMDDTGLARKNLGNYDVAVSILKQRVEYVFPKLDPELVHVYRDGSISNLLFGFLSHGNMNAARRWYKDEAKKVLRGSIRGWLAGFSVVSGINLYFIVRRVRVLVGALSLFGIQKKYGRFLHL